MSDVAKELMFLFFATTALKKDPASTARRPSRARSRRSASSAPASWARASHRSPCSRARSCGSRTPTSRASARGSPRCSEVLRERLKKKQITRLQFDDQMLLAGGTVDYSGFGRVDLVIEAVFEDLALKHRVLREVEPLLRDDAIFASNTSTIPISRIAEAASRPDRVLGMHFFSPVHKMPLLEVIVTRRDRRRRDVTAVAYGKQLGKTVIVVNDAPGFYTTRILSAVHERGRPPARRGRQHRRRRRGAGRLRLPGRPDHAARRGRHRRRRQGRARCWARRSASAWRRSDSLRRVVESGRTGRKGRKGFYLYDETGKKGGVDPSVYEVLPGGAQRRDDAGATRSSAAACWRW